MGYKSKVNAVFPRGNRPPDSSAREGKEERVWRISLSEIYTCKWKYDIFDLITCWLPSPPSSSSFASFLCLTPSSSLFPLSPLFLHSPLLSSPLRDIDLPPIPTALLSLSSDDDVCHPPTAQATGHGKVSCCSYYSRDPTLSESHAVRLYMYILVSSNPLRASALSLSLTHNLYIHPSLNKGWYTQAFKE